MIKQTYRKYVKSASKNYTFFLKIFYLIFFLNSSLLYFIFIYIYIDSKLGNVRRRIYVSAVYCLGL